MEAPVTEVGALRQNTRQLLLMPQTTVAHTEDVLSGRSMKSHVQGSPKRLTSRTSADLTVPSDMPLSSRLKVLSSRIQVAELDDLEQPLQVEYGGTLRNIKVWGGKRVELKSGLWCRWEIYESDQGVVQSLDM